MKKLYLLSILFPLFLTFFIFTPLIPQARADWPIFQFNPQHDGTDNSETSLTNPLSLEWQVPQVSNANIVESGNSIYAKTSSGSIYSIDINSGTINWQVQTQNGGEIAFGNNTVYAANGNYIDAYNASNGQHLWTTPDSYNGIPGITYVDGTLYFGSVGSHRLYAVSGTTGSRLWEAGMNDSAFAAPAVVNGVVYVGNYQNGMYAFNAATGAQIWLSNTNGGNYYQSPTVENNIVYNANHTGGIDAFDASTGNLLYQHPFYLGTSTNDALAYSDNTIYTAGENGHVYAFDPSNGQLKWNYTTGSPDNGAAPIIANGVLYYGNQSTLYGLDKQNGSLIWQYNTGSVQRIINSNHKLLVSSSNGLYAFTSNQAPTVNQLSATTIDVGSSYTTNGSFTDTDSTSWTATVDYGDGSGVQPLTLLGMNFTLNHQYNSVGEYTVIVGVTDNQSATGTANATVTVNHALPVTITFNSVGDIYVRGGEQNRNLGGGSFMKLQSSGSNRSLVRFDQSAMQSSIGNHQVLSAKLRLTITDNGNNWGTVGRTVDIHRLISDWVEGDGTESDRGSGSGSTWNCVTDSNIANQNDDCSGSSAWNMTNSSSWPFASATTATTTIANNQSGVIELDVTSDVQSFMNGSIQNHGWIIKKTNESQAGQVSFGTKESSTVPQLVVVYQP